MIKFLRKNRKKHLTESKLRKYLIYAVGEIILVVIGILIAVQINDWRIETKHRQIETVLLNNIKKDLEKDIQELRRVRKFNLKQNEICIRLLEYLIDTSKPLEDTIQFSYDIQRLVFFSNPNSNRTSYDLAINTGYLNNISNDSVVSELSNYYNDAFLDRHLEDTERFINNYYENNLMQNYPIFSKNVIVTDGHDGEYVLKRYKNDKRPILQLNDIRGDISLENYLNDLSMRLIIGVKGLESKEEFAKGLILLIENQLIKID